MSLRVKAFIAFVLAMFGVQMALGIWQWNRRGEKRAFITAIAEAAKGPAKPLAEAEIWSKVTLTGRYLHDKTAYVRSSRPEPKPGERDSQGRKLAPGSFGVFVLTPFVTRLCDSAGACKLTTLYVNRGFVPTPPDGRIPVYDRLDDPVSITGFLRPSEKPGLFQPGNDPAKGTYFTRSIEEMAKAAGLFRADENPSPYARFLDRQADENESAPPYGIAIADFLKAIPDNHTEYAITWWSLAAVNILFLGIFLISRRRQDAEAR